ARLVAHRKDATREGWRGEVCDRLGDVLSAVAGLMDRGVVLTIDYGYTRNDAAGPEGETLLAYHRHQWNDEIFLRVGEQDLTCHLDVDAFFQAGLDVGLSPAGQTT